jgi:MFS family permease
VLFGAGGGASYILVQQALNLAVTRRHGLANGYAVSLLPAGAMIAAPLFGWCIGALGVRAALWALAVVLAVTGVISAWLIGRSGVRLAAIGAADAPDADERRRLVFWQLWLGFSLAASAGLMVLRQAAGIIVAYGGATGMAATPVRPCGPVAPVAPMAPVDPVAPVAPSAPVDRARRQPRPDHLAGAGRVGALLALVGVGYGLISGVTAAAVAVYWRRALYGRIASRLYLAWCAAAIVLPIAAGRLFDLTQSYRTAVLISAAGNALGILIALGLPRRGVPRFAERSLEG